MSTPSTPDTTAPIPEPVVDASPALADTGVEFDHDIPDGVDAASMPAFKNFSRLLPADRLDLQLGLAEVLEEAPPGLLDGADAGDLSIEQEIARVKPLRKALRAMQEMLLDNAQDRDAMAEWLLAQGPASYQAMTWAFHKLLGALGNL